MKIPKLATPFPGCYFKKRVLPWFSGTMKPGTFLHTLFPLGVTIAPIQNTSLIHAKTIGCNYLWLSLVCFVCVRRCHKMYPRCMSWYVRNANWASHFVKNTKYTSTQKIVTCYLMTWILNIRYVHKRLGDKSKCASFKANDNKLKKANPLTISKFTTPLPGYYFKKPAPTLILKSNETRHAFLHTLFLFGMTIAPIQNIGLIHAKIIGCKYRK